MNAVAKKAKKGKTDKKGKKREKKERDPQFAYDKAVKTLGGVVCLYAAFIVAAIIFSVVYGLLFA